jgi:hypothetical protein
MGNLKLFGMIMRLLSLCCVVYYTLYPALLYPSLPVSALEPSAKEAPQHPAYILSIKAPPSVKTTDLRCLFQGLYVPFEHDQCQLPEHTLRAFFALIVTPSVEFKSDHGYPSMQRSPEIPCLWYNLTLEIHQQEASRKRTYNWKIEKLDPDDMPLRIPEHAGVVVLLPPKYIEGIESIHQEGHFVIHMPRLMLNTTLTQEELNSALEEIVLNLPEIKASCSLPKTIVKRQDTRVLTLNIDQSE